MKRGENLPNLKRQLCLEEDAGSNFKWRVMTDWRGAGLGLEFGGGAEDGSSEAGRSWRRGWRTHWQECPSRNFTIRYIQLNGMLYISHRISHEFNGNISLRQFETGHYDLDLDLDLDWFENEA